MALGAMRGSLSLREWLRELRGRASNLYMLNNFICAYKHIDFFKEPDNDDVIFWNYNDERRFDGNYEKDDEVTNILLYLLYEGFFDKYGCEYGPKDKKTLEKIKTLVFKRA